jgi:amino acid permease
MQLPAPLAAALALACPCCARHRAGSPRDALGGARDIGFLGGLCLLTNNILGTGMVQIPGLFQSAGWALPTLAFALTAAWTCVCALLLARVMTRLAGNASFEKRVEFANVLEDLLPRWAFLAALFALLASFVASNISNVVVSAQVADDILLQAAGRTCALVIYPRPAGGDPLFACVTLGDAGSQIANSPFGTAYVVSAGFLLVAAICVPLSYVALDENVVFQIIGVALNAGCVLVWAANFVAMGLSADNMPAFAAPSASSPPNWALAAYAPLLPTVLFNFGFVTTCPSWLNEKGPAISVTRTFVAACGLSAALYLVLGIFGALSPVDFTSSGADVLTIIVDGQTPGVWRASQIAAYVFPAANLMTVSRAGG